MRKYQRSPVWRFLYSPLVVGFLLLLSLLLARSLWGVYKKGSLAAERVTEAQYELEKLQDRQATLLKSVSGLEDKDGMERALRAKFPVSRTGEQVIVIGADAALDAVVATTTSEKRGFWNFVEGFWKKE